MANPNTNTKGKRMSRLKTDLMKSADGDMRVETCRKDDSNTLTYKLIDGSTAVQLHDTVVVRTYKDGAVRLDSGGWRTHTTKERMNKHARGVNVRQDKGLWYVHRNGDGRVPFYDGILIRPGKPLPTKGSNEEADKKETIKNVCKFCRAVEAHLIAKGFPMPSAGDCMICSMLERDIKPGSKTGDTMHLVSHMKETYIHGSLLVNALKWAGYREPLFIAIRSNSVGPELVVRALRRFLRRQLGIA